MPKCHTELALKSNLKLLSCIILLRTPSGAPSIRSHLCVLYSSPWALRKCLQDLRTNSGSLPVQMKIAVDIEVLEQVVEGDKLV